MILQRWMSGLKGWLAVATITLAMMFAACVGVVGASETAIGLLAFPSMQRARYSNALASGVVCVSVQISFLSRRLLHTPSST